jgi:hypothetical protein
MAARAAAALAAALALACAAVPANAAFPGRNGLIATVYDGFDRGGGVDMNLRLLDRNGRVKAKFARCSRPDESEPVSGACPSDPAFFADGRRIAYGLGSRIALQAVAGGAPVVLARLTERDADPYPSPGGGKLVFTGRVAGKRNLFTVNADGSGLQQITRHGGQSPAWSSRGELAYSAGGKVWRMRPGGSRAYVATGGRPDWSPSGRSVVYLRRGSVYRVPARGGRARRLVRGFALSAAFSPDGQAIAFGRVVDIGGSLFTARSSHGGRARRIALGGELPVGSTWLRWERPVWQPRRISGS